MTKQPKKGIVYRTVFTNSKRVIIPIYQVKTIRKRLRNGRYYPQPTYAIVGYLYEGDTFVTVDGYKTANGHNEIYVFTSRGDVGWLALHVAGVFANVGFQQCESSDENSDSAD